MICPKCNIDMIVVEHADVELDYCTKCHGAWFDSGELELLLEKAGIDSPLQFIEEMLARPEAHSDEKKRKCPICNHKMKKVAMGGDGSIVVDTCFEGDGLWFDGGEVIHLVKLMAESSKEVAGSQQDVLSFLGEVFKAEE